MCYIESTCHRILPARPRYISWPVEAIFRTSPRRISLRSSMKRELDSRSRRSDIRSFKHEKAVLRVSGTDDRAAFEENKRIRAIALGRDRRAFAAAVRALHAADKHDYPYLWSWMGVPIIQLPADIIATQERRRNRTSLWRRAWPEAARSCSWRRCWNSSAKAR